MSADFSWEAKLLGRGLRAVGTDEVGRGCLAGPVVAAAVAVPESLLVAADKSDGPWWRTITDSKLLTAKKREALAAKIWEEWDAQVAWSDPSEIDRINILHASLKAMRQCLWPFAGRAEAVLVDGHMDPYRGKESRSGEARALGFQEVIPLVKGDQKSVSIAAASIVAKVFRDRWMASMGEFFPGYGFSEHKGYPTPVHKRALGALGPCELHRRSFCLDPGPWKDSSEAGTASHGL